MKKILSIFLLTVLCASVFSCGKGDNSGLPPQGSQASVSSPTNAQTTQNSSTPDNSSKMNIFPEKPLDLSEKINTRKIENEPVVKKEEEKVIPEIQKEF